LLENAGANALFTILPTARFEDNGVDPLKMEQVREHEPGGPGAYDSDLDAGGWHSAFTASLGNEVGAAENHTTHCYFERGEEICFFPSVLGTADSSALRFSE
jgi:hypothetical protein